MYSLPIAAHANARLTPDLRGGTYVRTPQGDAAENGPPRMAAYRQAAYAEAERAARSCAVCSGGESQEAARVELPQPVLAVDLTQRAWR